MTDLQRVQQLQELLTSNLKRSDRSIVAREHGVSRTWVGTVLREMRLDSPVMHSLIERANHNKRQAELAAQQIDTLIQTLK
jgi:hypothetical protein